LIAVKPVARWQIWLGKWLGLVLLNAALLALAGGGVYGLLLWRAQQLPPKEQAVLRNEIFVARGSLKEPRPDLERDVEAIFKQRLAQTPLPAAEQPALRHQIREQLKAGTQVVPPGYPRVWVIDLGLRRHFLRDQPLYLRVKFHAVQTNAANLYVGGWQVGVPNKTQVWQQPMKMAADTFQEFAIPPNLFDEDGRLTVLFLNGTATDGRPTSLLFPLEDGFEVLYREGGFALNYARGLAIILFWLALLAALGLAAASFLSFPVAAFFSISLLVVSLSGGTLSAVVEEGTVTAVNHETGAGGGGWIDFVLIPFFKVLLSIVNVVQGFSPVEALSAGRSISWGQLCVAFAQIVILLGGILAIGGIVLFTRRELATAQGTS
jgi:hypothetical protein